MGWRDWFKAAPALPPETDARLGELTWVPEYDGWCGKYNGFTFVLAHKASEYAPDELKDYAVEMLNDPASLQAALLESISAAPSYLKPFGEEMAELEYRELHFSLNRRGPYLFAELGPGRDYRCWRLEFTDHKCEGIGFDS
jgi:hypothetical protein